MGVLISECPILSSHRYAGANSGRGKASRTVHPARIVLPFMRNSTNVRDFGGLVDTMFSVRDQIRTCCEITYDDFSGDSFDKRPDFAIVILKPTSHINGNFTPKNTTSMINRLGNAGWFPRAVRLFRGQALPQRAVISNYQNPFAGSVADHNNDVYLRRDPKGQIVRGSGAVAAKGKEEDLKRHLASIYGGSVEDLIFLHSFDLLEYRQGPLEFSHPMRDLFGKFPIEFITALWKKGYGVDKFEKDRRDGINRIPDKGNELAKNPKTRVFLITRKLIDDVLEEMGWETAQKNNVRRTLRDLGLLDENRDDAFIISNGFACELLQALNRPDEFVPVFLFQRGRADCSVDYVTLRTNIIGDTNPLRALPGSIRGDAYLWHKGNRGVHHPIIVPDVVEIANNICHCSEDQENSLREFGLWFDRSLFQTLLMGSPYPDEQRYDMEDNSVIGAKAVNFNMVNDLLSGGVKGFADRFVPVRDSGPGSASITYRHWMELRDQYKADMLNIGSHRDTLGEFVPAVDGKIEALAPHRDHNGAAAVRVRYIAAAGGQNFRYFPLSRSERLRAKFTEVLPEIDRSPIGLKLSEILNAVAAGDEAKLKVLPLYVTNNYNHAIVSDHIRTFLTGIDEGLLRQFHMILAEADGKDDVVPGNKTDLVNNIADRIVHQSGSLPRVIPQWKDLVDNQLYRMDQLGKWSRYYAPKHYFSRENGNCPPLTGLPKDRFNDLAEKMINAGLIDITPEERSCGKKDSELGLFMWRAEVLLMSDQEFSSKISGFPAADSEVVTAAWKDIRCRIMGDMPRTPENCQKTEPYGFEHYLERAANDITSGKGDPGDYCLDRNNNLTCKSPGHMDAVTSYVVNQMAADLRSGIRSAFVSCAEDFAIDITDDLRTRVEKSQKIFTFLVNKVKSGGNLPEGGFVLSPVDQTTGLTQWPRLYEKFQFWPQAMDVLRGSKGCYHNLLQVGINLENLGSYLFGACFQGFKSGEMSEEDIKETLWNRLYSRLQPVVEVRAVDQGHIWAAQFVYFLGQVSHISDDNGEPISEFLRSPHESGFPFVQIKYPEQSGKALEFYQANETRFKLPEGAVAQKK